MYGTRVFTRLKHRRNSADRSTHTTRRAKSIPSSPCTLRCRRREHDDAGNINKAENHCVAHSLQLPAAGADVNLLRCASRARQRNVSSSYRCTCSATAWQSTLRVASVAHMQSPLPSLSRLPSLESRQRKPRPRVRVYLRRLSSIVVEER